MERLALWTWGRGWADQCPKEKQDGERPPGLCQGQPRLASCRSELRATHGSPEAGR